MSVDSFAEILVSWLVVASWQLAIFIAIVAVATTLLKNAAPRLRHGLWLLVLVKALLPPTLGGPSLPAPWAAGNWAVAPVTNQLPAAARELVTIPALDSQPPEQAAKPAPLRPSEPTNPATSVAGEPWQGPSLYTMLAAAWLLGAAIVATALVVGYTRVRRAVRRLETIDEGPARVALERAAIAIGLPDATAVDLRLSETPAATFLIGVRRPTIVISRATIGQLAADELIGVFAHELVHWHRRDTLVGWLQAIVVTLYWFHPLVWWASTRLRDERERCCDDEVLRRSAVAPDRYGEAIVRSLTLGHGRPSGLSAPMPLAAAGMVGIFERGSALQQRMEDIMAFQPSRGRFGWPSLALLAVFAAVFVPLAGATNPASEELLSVKNKVTEVRHRPRPPYPVVVKTVPELGATEVDPELDSLTVTYDRDMDTSKRGGNGWKETLPPTDDRRKSEWIDKRTCVIPVSLADASYYQMYLKSEEHGGFYGANGSPAQHAVIAFATKDAPDWIRQRARIPKIVELRPPNGADDVDPTTDTISVTFDIPMCYSTSWVKTDGDQYFPGIKQSPGLSTPERWPGKWSDNRRTCSLSVKLEPGRTYRFSLNGSHELDFQSRDYVPLAPTVWTFATKVGEQLSPVRKEIVADKTEKEATADLPYPSVVKTVPEIGATDVSPSLDEIRVTFDRDMTVGRNYSWTGGGEDFPYVDESREAKWIDARTCVLPVKLTKGKFYRVGVNAKSYQNFKSADGTPAAHAVIAFATEGAKRSVARKALVPEIVELSPENGAEGIDPSTKSISVTFNTRMAGGMSWVRTDSPFPGTESGRATWSKDGKTCTLPVELQPGETYKLSLNGSHYINFQSNDGVPAPATVWSFTTKAE